MFCKNPKQILTRQRLLERLWDADENYVDEHTLTTSISRIRGKIEAESDSNQMSRKRENSILRSVGLTERQLCRMNVIEGMCYAFFAMLMVLIVGVPVSVVIYMEVSKKSFAGKVVPYQFPFLQMGLFLLVLFGMEVILSALMMA